MSGCGHNPPYGGPKCYRDDIGLGHDEHSRRSQFTNHQAQKKQCVLDEIQRDVHKLKQEIADAEHQIRQLTGLIYHKETQIKLKESEYWKEYYK